MVGCLSHFVVVPPENKSASTTPIYSSESYDEEAMKAIPRDREVSWISMLVSKPVDNSPI